MAIETYRIRCHDGTKLLCGLQKSSDPTHARRGFLLVPGFWGDWRRSGYLGVIEDLGQYGTVLASNLRGHPGSSGWFTFGKKETSDMGALIGHMKELGIEEITACGFSMGGWVLAAHLAEAPEDRSVIRHLVLAGVPSRLPWIMPRFWRKGLWVQLRHGGRGMIRANPLSLFPPRDLSPALERLDGIPITVLHGEKDWMVDDAHGRALYDSLKGPRQWIFLPDRRGLHVEMLAYFHKDVLLEAILTSPKGAGAVPGGA